MRILSCLALLVLGLSFTSCKNDLDLTAPYKDIPNVFAVLNHQDQQHVIRVNKVFLGEGNANDMARVADSVNYGPGEITVSLSRVSQGSVEVIPFGESMIETAAGAFNPNQRIYVSSAKLYPNNIYTLTVHNNKSGNTFTSVSRTYDEMPAHPFFPLAGLKYPYPPNTHPSQYLDYSVMKPAFPYLIRYIPGDAKVYQVYLRMHFYDSLRVLGNSYNHVDFLIGKKNREEVEQFAGAPVIKHDFDGSMLFSAVGIGLSKMNLNNAILGRKMYKGEFMLYYSSQEYLDYMEYVRPSLSISQAKPLYSNISNGGIGIFTFRSYYKIEKALANTFISEFARNSATCRFNFFDAALQKPGCR